MKTRSVTCYRYSYYNCAINEMRNWIKTSGMPNGHIFVDLTDLQKCFLNDVLCGGKNRSHPVLYINSTFRGAFNNETSAERILQNKDL